MELKIYWKRLNKNKKQLFFYSFKCKRCVNNIQVKLPPEDTDCTSSLSQWFHCSNNKGLPDIVLSQAWDVTKAVSFVFHHRSSAAVAKTEPTEEELEEKEEKELPMEDVSSEDEIIAIESDTDSDDDFWK